MSKIYRDGNNVTVWGIDTLSGQRLELEADLVVLAISIDPHPSTLPLSKILKIGVDEEGFLKEAHPKLRPVESLTAGIFLAGAGQAPKDIPEAVSQASGAASKAVGLLAQKELTHSPEVCHINEDICSGCAICVQICPYDALSINGTGVSEVNEVLCEGCGTCVSACPSGAAQLKNMTDDQYTEMIKVALRNR